MIKTNNTGYFIVISGPTCAGKGTICKELIKHNKNLQFSVSMTTRDIRVGEVDGKDYYFVSKEEFEKKIKEDYFLEYAIVHNNDYYGTPKEKTLELLNNGINIILEIDIQGALKLKEKFPNALYIFILPPSMSELKKRLIKRGTESEEKMLDRFKRAYHEINEVSKYNYVVVNDELELAVKKVEAILIAENCRVDRIVDIDLNTIEEDVHEELIEE